MNHPSATSEATEPKLTQDPLKAFSGTESQVQRFVGHEVHVNCPEFGTVSGIIEKEEDLISSQPVQPPEPVFMLTLAPRYYFTSKGIGGLRPKEVQTPQPDGV